MELHKPDQSENQTDLAYPAPTQQTIDGSNNEINDARTHVRSKRAKTLAGGEPIRRDGNDYQAARNIMSDCKTRPLFTLRNDDASLTCQFLTCFEQI
jgi:hypothetical protein